VRSDDVKFGWEQVKRDDSPHGQQPYFKNSVKDIEIVGPKEFIVRMNKPDGIFVTAVSDYQGGMEVRSKADFDANGAPGWGNKGRPLAGSGPYQWKEGAEGQFIRLERANNNHWTGTPDFKEFEWRFAKEASTRMAALLTGEAHMGDLPQDLLQQAEKQSMKVLRGQFPGTRVWVSFRCCYSKDQNDFSKGWMYPDSPLMNPKVRQALSKAINRDEMNKAFFAGKGETMYLNHFHPNRLGWNKEWETRFPDMYGYDVAKAKQLLAEAGQTALKTTMAYAVIPGVPAGADLTEAVASYWRAVGVTASMEPVELPQFNAQNRALANSNITKVEASGSNQWSGSTIWNSGVTHIGNGVESQKMDTVLRQIAVTIDPAKQEELWRQAGNAGYEEFMNAPLFWLPTEVVVNPKVVAEWTWPGGITGAWTHIVGIKAAAK
jgi:ABC-type transport system substrate-binding protein